MSRTFTLICWAALAAGLRSQVPDKLPSFDSVVLRPSKPNTTESGFIAGGKADFRAITLLDLISLAWGLEGDRILGGPSWLDTSRFDLIATAAASTSDETMLLMLQALLDDRFELAVHKEEKPLPVYTLTVGKRGPKLKESAGDGDGVCNIAVNGNLRTYTCQNMTMGGFAAKARSVAAAYLDHPVVDATGLKGSYDFALTWTPHGQLARKSGDSEASSGISFFDAVDKNLGLKLEAGTKPMPVLAIDHVNQTPKGIASPVTSSTPAGPKEFEVADIKLSKPGTSNTNARLMRGGRLEMQGITLKEMISIGYNVDDDMVMGGEQWIDSDRFDIVAKAGTDVPFDELRTMLASLLKERFKLAVHSEVKPVTVYALTVTKRNPKLKESSGAERSGCKVGAGDGTRMYTCQNTTMAQLAEKIRDAASGYLDHTVVDLTGLSGAYDFALSWSPIRRFRAATSRPADSNAGGGATPGAADPTGEISLFEAFDKQLGLKLATQKHPMTVVVVDHANRTPDN